jgi:hypothetical protein
MMQGSIFKVFKGMKVKDNNDDVVVKVVLTT